MNYRKLFIPSFIILAFVAFFMRTLPASSAQAKREVIEQDIQRVLRNHEQIELDAPSVASRVRETGRLTLSGEGESFDLEFVPQEMRAPGYRAEEVDADGTTHPVASLPVRTFKGSVAGRPDAQARFTIDNDKVEGVIFTSGEKYFVEPLRKYSSAASQTDYVFYRGSDIIQTNPETCGVTLDDEIQQTMQNVAPKDAQTAPGYSTQLSNATQTNAPNSFREVELATEADFEFVTAAGGSTQANAELLSVMNYVDGVYETELGMTFRVVYQHTWAANNDPYNSTDSTTVLNEFTNYWNSNFAGTHRDLAHMWTGKSMDNFVIGKAWVGVTCYLPNQAYGISQRLSSLPMEYVTAAHEIGHNFNASHVTDASCTNTIMNPSLGPSTALDFCPASRTEISNFVNAHSSCLSVVTGTGALDSVQFGAGSYSVNEGAGSISINVTRTGAGASASSVDYTTSDGTARERSDYTIASGTINFAAGELSKTFDVLVTDNAYVDGSRTVNLTLSNPSNATLGTQTTAVLTITNNDGAQPTSNPIDNAQFFVRQHYYDFLNRAPDQGGLDYWTGQITQCGTNQSCLNSQRIGVSAAYFIELEFQDTGSFVYRMYKASYGARPTYAQFMPDRSRIVAGPGLEASKQAFADQWVTRASFQQAYPLTLTNDQFVGKLYDTAGLVPYTAERQQQSSAMNLSGKTRAQVLRDVIETQAFKDREYNQAFVLMQYFGYLRRDPDQGGYDFWVNVLNNRQPNNYRGMVCAFLTSAEYQQRFSSIVTRTNADCAP